MISETWPTSVGFGQYWAAWPSTELANPLDTWPMCRRLGQDLGSLVNTGLMTFPGPELANLAKVLWSRLAAVGASARAGRADSVGRGPRQEVEQEYT
jgi:hypothetical protein